MGARHQLFVIARVGNHFRCLAVVHRQVLKSWDALRVCMRLIQVFSDKSNRLALEMELRLAAEFYQDHGPPARYQLDLEAFRSNPVRFPFISTCLVLGAGTERDLVWPSAVHLEPQETGFDQGDNNEGITVLDISDLDNVRYCFTSWHRIGDRYNGDVVVQDTPPPLYKPWTGWEYVRHYLVDGEDSPFTPQDGPEIANKLDKVPLVHVSALADVWPWGDWVLDHPEGAPTMPEGPANKTGVTSLKDMALAKLVEDLLSTPRPDLGLLDAPMRTPNFRESLTDHLYMVRDRLLNAPGAPAILRAAFAGQTFLDWARFSGLPPATITAAAQSPELKDAQGLALCPDWSSTSPSDLAEAICAFPQLRDLYLMELPGRPSDGPIGEFYIALAANPRCPKAKIWLSAAASRALNQRFWLPTDAAFSPPPSFPILQLVVVRHSTMSHFPLYTYHYLADGFLTPTRFASGLLGFLGRHQGWQSGPAWSLFLSQVLACAASNFDDAPPAEVSPLPAETYTVSKRSYHNSAFRDCYTKMRDLVPGTWTVLLYTADVPDQPPPCNFDLQLASIRAKNAVIKANPRDQTPFGPDDVEVLDLAGFLRAVAPDVDFAALERKLAWLDELRDIDEILNDTPTRPRLSQTPMDGQTACDLLKEAIGNLPKVYDAYRQSMNELRPDEAWYPELNLEPVEG